MCYPSWCKIICTQAQNSKYINKKMWSTLFIVIGYNGKTAKLSKLQESMRTNRHQAHNKCLKSYRTDTNDPVQGDTLLDSAQLNLIWTSVPATTVTRELTTTRKICQNVYISESYFFTWTCTFYRSSHDRHVFDFLVKWAERTELEIPV